MNRKPSMLVVFLTVFIDLVGFGIVVPLVPIYSRHYDAGWFIVGAIVAAYSAMQFIFSPIWGRLSDQFGRRPILLTSSAGAALSYVLFAIGSGIDNATTALTVLFLSRCFAGIGGGNITVAQAYIADITPPENRSKRMGLVGVAFGLGFILGPAISGLALKFFGETGPGWTAAALCGANFLLAFVILGESLQPSSTHANRRPHLKQWGHTLSHPKIGALILIFFLATFAFSCFETTLPLLVNDNFNLHLTVDLTKPAMTVVLLFVYCGLISAFVQGGAIGRLVKMLGEPKLIALSLVMTGVAMILLPFIKGEGQLKWMAVLRLADWPWIKMLLVLALLSIGTSLTRPPVFGLLSNLTPATEQGATIGVAQGISSLARIVGPLFALMLYWQHPVWPYIICGAIAILAGILAILRLSGTDSTVSGKNPGAAAE